MAGDPTPTSTADEIPQVAQHYDRSVFADMEDAFYKGNSQRPGEFGLVLAVFHEALENLQLDDKTAKKREAKKDAYEWFSQGEDYSYIFSFYSVCSMLGYDAKAVQRRVLSGKVGREAFITTRYKAKRAVMEKRAVAV